MTIKCPNPLCGYENEANLSKCQLCGSSLPRITLAEKPLPQTDPVEESLLRTNRAEESHRSVVMTLIGKVKVIGTDQEYPSENPEKERRLQFYIRVIDTIPTLLGSSMVVIAVVLFFFPGLFMGAINAGASNFMQSSFSFLLFIGILFYLYIAIDKKNFLDISGIFSSMFSLMWQLINAIARGIRAILSEMLRGMKRHFQEELNTLRNRSHRHPIPIRNLRVIEEDSQMERSIQVKGNLNTSDIQVGDSIQADGQYSNEGVFIPVSLRNLGTNVMIWSQK